MTDLSKATLACGPIYNWVVLFVCPLHAYKRHQATEYLQERHQMPATPSRESLDCPEIVLTVTH